MAKEIIYYVDATVAPPIGYGTDGEELSRNNARGIFRGELATASFQLTDGAPIFTTTGVLENPYTSFSALSITNSVTVDNNFLRGIDALLKTTLTASVPVSTISMSYSGTPRELGFLKLTNNAGETESVNYNGYVLDSGTTYIFTTADVDFTVSNFTPTYSHAIDDNGVVYESPIIQSESNVADNANGLYTCSLDADNPVYDNLIGSSTSISNTQIELNLYEAGRPVFVYRTDFSCDNRMATDFSDPLPPSADYTILDSRFVKLDLSTYSVATLTGSEYLYIGTSEKITTDGLVAYLAANTYPDLDFVVGDLTANSLTITGLVTIGQIVDHDGVPLDNINSAITYGATNTTVDLTAWVESGELSTNTWTVKFSGGQDTQTTIQGYDKRTFDYLTVETSGVRYITLDDETKYISGTIDNPTSIKIWVKSNSATITGNAYLQIVNLAGNSDTKVVVAVTTSWVEHTITVALTDFSIYGILRDETDPLDTLDDGGAPISLLIASPCEVC